MSLLRCVIVPAAPLLLPAASPRQPEEVRDAVAELRATATTALGVLADADTVVLLASGAEPLTHDVERTTLDSYGLPDADRLLTIDRELLSAIQDRGQAPLVRSERLDGDLAVLALQVLAVAPTVRVVPVTVPAGAGADALSATAAGLRAAIEQHDRRVAIVAAGDLAATLDTTSPGYVVADAGRWDEAATEAVAATDPTALAALGPEAAADVQARGWAPVTVVLAVAAASELHLDATEYHAPRGVGQIVAW